MSSAKEELDRIRIQKDLDQKNFNLKEKLKREKEETEYALREAKREKELQQREKFVKSVSQKVFAQTGLLSQLKELEQKECANVRKHGIVISYGTAYSSVRLAWGNKFTINGDYIDYEKGLFDRYGKKDFDYIEIQIDPDSEEISVNRSTISANEWKRDQSLLSKEIAQAFLDPCHCQDDDRPHSDPFPFQQTTVDGR